MFMRLFFSFFIAATFFSCSNVYVKELGNYTGNVLEAFALISIESLPVYDTCYSSHYPKAYRTVKNTDDTLIQFRFRIQKLYYSNEKYHEYYVEGRSEEWPFQYNNAVVAGDKWMYIWLRGKHRWKENILVEMSCLLKEESCGSFFFPRLFKINGAEEKLHQIYPVAD